ncbi:MAG: hypothetical protein JXP34_03310 [Planctomycetes bacterium]|nr:hypothetical protein [Planctomycetota bacterium]
MMATVAEVLEKQLEEGRVLLRARPLDKDRYEAWWEIVRDAYARAFGETSKETKEIISAHRPITVTYDLDPSFYLTQVGANLRREMKLLEQGAAAAKTRAAAAAEAPSGVPVAIFPEAGGTLGKKLAAFLKGSGAEPALVGMDPDGTLPSWIAGGEAEKLGGAVVVLTREAAGKGKPAGASAESLFLLGVAAGALGADRVCAVCESALELPGAASAIAIATADDPEKLGETLLGCLAAWAARE